MTVKRRRRGRSGSVCKSWKTPYCAWLLQAGRGQGEEEVEDSGETGGVLGDESLDPRSSLRVCEPE